MQFRMQLRRPFGPTGKMPRDEQRRQRRPQRGPQLKAWIIVALCGMAALASGCSAVRLGYGQGPFWAYRWLDGYVDFNDAQAPQVRGALAEWFAWHRRTQLPDYAALLARAQVEVLADTTQARACEWQSEVTQRLWGALDHAAPAVADLLPTVTPEQIRHIERRYAESNAEYREAYLQPDPAERTQATLERTIERAESVYGRLDDRQRERIAATLARSPFDPELWFAERRERQLDALRLVRQLAAEGAGRQLAEAALREYVARIDRSPREAYRRYAARLSEFNCAFAADLHNQATLAQRQAAAQKLAGWERDARSLAGGS